MSVVPEPTEDLLYAVGGGHGRRCLLALGEGFFGRRRTPLILGRTDGVCRLLLSRHPVS